MDLGAVTGFGFIAIILVGAYWMTVWQLSAWRRLFERIIRWAKAV